jgi:hypothetical protein
MFPFDEDFCVYDFEVDPEDEEVCAFPLSMLAGNKPDNSMTEGSPR